MHKPKRIVASIYKNPEWPSIIYFCCMHGNEKAGYHALNHIFKHVESLTDDIKGNIFAIFGNQEAFIEGLRFKDKDLNRIWTKSHIQEAIQRKDVSEYQELQEIYQALYTILNNTKSQVYTIDLHTTSSPTKPFIVMNDALNNRAFVRDLGYPVIFNVETYIEGTLLSLLNDLGYVSLAFEGGDHYGDKSVEEMIKFCFKTLYHTGIINMDVLVQSGISKKLFLTKSARYFEIIFRQNLTPEDNFTMLGKYKNFQKLKKGESIALLNDTRIKAPKSYQIFMPLYQNKGEDAFFYIQHINSFKLKVARILRKLKIENLLTIIPGINKTNFYTLSIPRPILKFIPKRLLFALGYRKSVELENNNICFTKQERKLKSLPKMKKFVSPYQLYK